jgi:prevent-host-death family protein
MITVDFVEAKTRLPELLDRVERGEEVLIARHGKNVARLVADIPAHVESERADVKAKAAWLTAELERIRDNLLATGGN